MDSLLGGLFGGQDDDDDNRRRSRADDFVSRYEQGAPEDGLNGDEVYHNYSRVAGQLSPEQYEQAAEQSFSRMSPQQRSQFGQMLQQRMGNQGGDVQLDDPRQLAGLTSRFRQQDQGGLASLFGMGGGGGGNRGGGGGGGLGDMLDNPLAKAALGGVAAIAMKNMLGRR